jgi:hypothetical protein
MKVQPVLASHADHRSTPAKAAFRQPLGRYSLWFRSTSNRRQKPGACGGHARRRVLAALLPVLVTAYLGIVELVERGLRDLAAGPRSVARA